MVNAYTSNVRVSDMSQKLLIITNFGDGEHARTALACSPFQIMEKPHYFWCPQNQLQSVFLMSIKAKGMVDNKNTNPPYKRG